MQARYAAVLSLVVAGSGGGVRRLEHDRAWRLRSPTGGLLPAPPWFSTAPACPQFLWGCTTAAAGCSGSNSCGSATWLYLSREPRQAFAAATGANNPETLQLTLKETESYSCQNSCLPAAESGRAGDYKKCVSNCQEHKTCLLREVQCTVVFIDGCGNRVGLSCITREKGQKPVQETRELSLPAHSPGVGGDAAGPTHQEVQTVPSP
jgi:hypothetical protein